MTTIRSVLRRSAARTGFPVWRRLRARMETIADQAANRAIDHASRLTEPLHDELAQLRETVAGLRAELDVLRGRQDTWEHHTKLVPEQVAAIETRLGEVEVGGRPVVSSGAEGGGGAEARAVLEEIRTEHRRIRARLAAVASYEERIGRLEHAITEEHRR